MTPLNRRNDRYFEELLKFTRIFPITKLLLQKEIPYKPQNKHTSFIRF